MKVAESLYLSGFITYPRTESTAFSPSFNFNEVVANHINNREWGNYANKLLKEGIETPKQGIDKGDHPPITPVKSANKE